MPLFLCIIPNRGARIGHQTHEHFCFVTYCKLHNFNFVYHPFMSNSERFEKVLNFGNLHTLHYNKLNLSAMNIIKIETIANKNIHNTLLELHKDKKDNLVYGHICGTERFLPYLNISREQIVSTKLFYREKLANKFPKKYNYDYISIHLRCGDIANDKSRYLSEDYFLDTYKKLIATLDNKGLPVIFVTERNFKNIDKIKTAIPNCIIANGTDIDAFHILVNSKYLIASRSGFSNLAYVLGNMKVVKPPADWNYYYDNLITL